MKYPPVCLPDQHTLFRTPCMHFDLRTAEQVASCCDGTAGRGGGLVIAAESCCPASQSMHCMHCRMAGLPADRPPLHWCAVRLAVASAPGTRRSSCASRRAGAAAAGRARRTRPSPAGSPARCRRVRAAGWQGQLHVARACRPACTCSTCQACGGRQPAGAGRVHGRAWGCGPPRSTARTAPRAPRRCPSRAPAAPAARSLAARGAAARSPAPPCRVRQPRVVSADGLPSTAACTALPASDSMPGACRQARPAMRAPAGAARRRPLGELRARRPAGRACASCSAWSRRSCSATTSRRVAGVLATRCRYRAPPSSHDLPSRGVSECRCSKLLSGGPGGQSASPARCARTGTQQTAASGALLVRRAPLCPGQHGATAAACQPGTPDAGCAPGWQYRVQYVCRLRLGRVPCRLCPAQPLHRVAGALRHVRAVSGKHAARRACLQKSTQ